MSGIWRSRGRSGIKRGEGQALNNLGLAYGQLGQAWQARRYFEAAIALAQVIGSRHREGMVLANLVQIY